MQESLSQYAGAGIKLYLDRVISLVDRLKLCNMIDTEGITSSALRLIARVVPHLFCDDVFHVTSSSSTLKDVLVGGNVKGRVSSATPPQDLRAYLSMLALMQLCDVAIASSLLRLQPGFR